MENQQFENQEWRSRQPLQPSQPSQPSQQYSINIDPREQQGQEERGEQQAYYPQSMYVDPREKIQPMPRRRRRWLSIVAALVIIALLGSGMQAGMRSFQHSNTETRTYELSTGVAPTLVLNDDTGSITIQTGDSNNVTIQETQHSPLVGGAPDAKTSQDGNTITTTVENHGGFNSVDFNVTIPANATLQIHTSTGSIDVSGVSGTMSLTSDTGSITANQDALSGQSTLQTNTGDITFDGSLAPNGNYQFSTDTGSVDATLPANSSFHLDATTDTGSIDSDFTEVRVQHQDFKGDSAHGDVGSGNSNSGATVTMKTNTGDINLHEGQ